LWRGFPEILKFVLTRVFAVVQGPRPGLAGFDLEPRALTALLAVIRETELRGGTVTRVVGAGRPRPEVLAVDLVLRLRAVAPHLSEGELLAVLELLPI
jgi:hypothetical protein